ncbi:hypothetical protein [Candidiatus Paracoxiella cheracis]|uniref:hypothetical protein n=1 Tax=Candidiatus Paracoxiella cheracis TaxID=3405120 RepID=UPI003BF46E39
MFLILFFRTNVVYNVKFFFGFYVKQFLIIFINLSKVQYEVRPHSGERCYGKTPMQTFLDAKHLAQEKELDKLCKTIPSVSADELNKAHSNHDTQLVEE